jgi:hypothetical protein
LCVHRIFAGPEEFQFLDAQMLLDPLEEQFNLRLFTIAAG